MNCRRRRSRTTRHASRHGFTLTEVLVAMAVVSVVMTLVTRLLLSAMDVTRDLRARTTLQLQASELLDRFVADLRNAHVVRVAAENDAEHPEVAIKPMDGETIRYRWDATLAAYVRSAGKDTRPIAPTGLLVDRLHIDASRQPVHLRLQASRRVEGGNRRLVIELATHVQTMS